MYSHSATSLRVDKLRKARNINEIVAVLKEIALSIKLLGPKADKFTEALSSAQSLKGRLLQDVVNAHSSSVVDPVHANSQLIVSPELTHRFQASLAAIPRPPSVRTDQEVSIIRDGLNKIDFRPLPDSDGYETVERSKVNRTRKQIGVQIVPLKKFKRPPTDTLVKNNTILQQLFDNVEELKYAIQLLEQGFEPGEHRDAALKASQLLFKSADDRLAAAFEVLDNLSVKHMPTEMNRTSRALVKHLADTLPQERYSSVSEYCHVANYGDGGGIIFSFYHVIQGLKSDTGFVFDKYYVVYTGIVSGSGDKAGLRTYINTMPDFKLPGRYPLGTEVSSLVPSKVNQYVDEFLAQNDVSVVLESQAIPITKERLKNSGMANIPGVKNLYITMDGSLRVSLKPTHAAADKHHLVAAPLMLRLNRLLGNEKGKSKVTYKAMRKGDTVMLEFAMINSSGLSKKLSKAGLREIQDALNLTDAQVTQIREAQRNTD